MTCSDGSNYIADHVIVTVSLGVLKESWATMFTPSLPKPKQDAISGLSIGTVGKIFMEFDKPFWPDSWSGFSMLWTQQDIKDIEKTEFAWIRGIAGIWRVSYQPKILAAFLVGPNARKMELLTPQKLVDGIKFIFKKFLTNKLAYTAPKNVLTSKWYSNKHFRGGYSYRSLKSDDLKTSPSALAASLNDCSGAPRILFAGEATHSSFFSTVHGAIESGYREADQLVQYHAN